MKLDVPTSPAAHPYALHPRTLVGHRALHVKVLERQVEVVLRVRHGGAHHAADRDRRALWQVLEDRDRLLGGLAGDEVRHQPGLPRGDPLELRARLDFHDYAPAFTVVAVSAAAPRPWPLNVR